jgi:hypothetical protein
LEVLVYHLITPGGWNKVISTHHQPHLAWRSISLFSIAFSGSVLYTSRHPGLKQNFCKVCTCRRSLQSPHITDLRWCQWQPVQGLGKNRGKWGSVAMYVGRMLRTDTDAFGLSDCVRQAINLQSGACSAAANQVTQGNAQAAAILKDTCTNLVQVWSAPDNIPSHR